MGRSDISLIAAIAALITVLMIEVWLWVAFMPNLLPLAVITMMTPVMKMAAVLIILIEAAGLYCVVSGQSALTRGAAMSAVFVGLIATLCAELVVQTKREVIPTTLAFSAPQRFEGLLILAFGLLSAITLLGLGRLRRRAANG